MTRLVCEFVFGVALSLPITAMIATFDQWFPVVSGWM